jgi:hypothetical protein
MTGRSETIFHEAENPPAIRFLGGLLLNDFPDLKFLGHISSIVFAALVLRVSANKANHGGSWTRGSEGVRMGADCGCGA